MLMQFMALYDSPDFIFVGKYFYIQRGHESAYVRYLVAVAKDE